MNLADFKVGTRLSVGFAILLMFTIAVGGVRLMRLSQLDQMVSQLTRSELAQGAADAGTEARNRDSAAKFARLLMVDAESRARNDAQGEDLDEQSKAMAPRSRNSSRCSTRPRRRRCSRKRAPRAKPTTRRVRR